MKKYYGIIGRIPDQENEVYVIKAEDVKQALLGFDDAICEAYGFDSLDRRELEEVHGTVTYVDAVLESEAPITEVRQWT